MKAIDLYSGIGGWAFGFKMAGIDVIAGYDLWQPAVDTYNANFGMDHKPVNLRDTDPLKLHYPNEINIIVGSPPCTQFSFANRGGSGDIDDGLLDIRIFLDFVKRLKPKYWVMENVPRVAGILNYHLFNKNGKLYNFRQLCASDNFSIDVINCADYGVPQKRKRMIAGVYPYNLLRSYAGNFESPSLGNVIKKLSNKRTIVDPNYKSTLKRSELKDHLLEAPFTREEIRINSEMKTYHPVYNKMNFPEDMSKPSRTVTATCTKVSRESIVISGQKKGQFRRLTVRERASVQSFPIDFQLMSDSYNTKLKMVGNAIPPLLTYFIGKSILNSTLGSIDLKKDYLDCNFIPTKMSEGSQPEKSNGTYPKNRKFRYAIPGLRFGSGVRFQMQNHYMMNKTKWVVEYFFGPSKNVMEIKLDKILFDECCDLLNKENLNTLLEQQYRLKKINNDDLQNVWIRQVDGHSPFKVLDQLGIIARKIQNLIEHDKSSEIEKFVLARHQTVINELNDKQKYKLSKKCVYNNKQIFCGFIIGSWFNQIG